MPTINKDKLAQDLLVDAKTIIEVVSSTNPNAVLINLQNMNVNDTAGIETDAHLVQYLTQKWYNGQQNLVINAFRNVPFDHKEASQEEIYAVEKAYGLLTNRSYQSQFRQSGIGLDNLGFNQYDPNLFNNNTLGSSAPDAVINNSNNGNGIDWNNVGNVASDILAGIQQGANSQNSGLTYNPYTFNNTNGYNQNNNANQSSNSKTLTYIGIGFGFLIVLLLAFLVIKNQ